MEVPACYELLVLMTVELVRFPQNSELKFYTIWKRILEFSFSVNINNFVFKRNHSVSVFFIFKVLKLKNFLL